MIKVVITQTRYGNGQRKYKAGSITELTEEKAAIAVQNGWAKYIESQPDKPETETQQNAVNKTAESRQTAEVQKKTKRKYTRRPKKK
jgi:hypothetical protein